MPTYGLIWLIAVIAFIILEAVTYQMVSVWFVIGSIVALIVSLFDVGFGIQMTVFLAVSIALLVFLRRISLKLLKTQNLKTNAEGLIGKSILITEDVNNTLCTGRGKIEGLVWTVRSEDNVEIAAGTVARIKRKEGVKLYVA